MHGPAADDHRTQVRSRHQHTYASNQRYHPIDPNRRKLPNKTFMQKSKCAKIAQVLCDLVPWRATSRDDQLRHHKVHTRKEPAEKFIRCFLQHVMPNAFRKVRHYGLGSAHRQRVVHAAYLNLGLDTWLDYPNANSFPLDNLSPPPGSPISFTPKI